MQLYMLACSESPRSDSGQPILFSLLFQKAPPSDVRQYGSSYLANCFGPTRYTVSPTLSD